MFERILIKSGSNNVERFLSIADLVDMMFYYGEVHVVASQFELKQLLTIFGEDILYELITTGRLIAHPCYQNIEGIHIKAFFAEASFMSFYKIEGNLRIDELNTIHQKLGYNGNFSYSNVLMALGETNIDCYMASELQAEMIANRRWTEVYKLRMNECIKQAEGSQENIDHFREMAANDFLSPGASFVAGLLSPQELLKDLICNDSVKFREWLSKIPSGQPLTGELYNEIQGQFSNKNWVKGVRSLSQILTGLINPIAGAVHTFLDGFVGDKLINGWKPAMFISSVLTKDSMKK